MTANDKPDFLLRDPVIPGQEWIVISFVDGKKLAKCKQEFSIMKFRGAFSTQEEASAHAASLQAGDPYCNIYVGPGFTWIPAEDDPEKAKEGKFAEPEMNNLMERYLTNQAKAKEMYQRRKNEMLMETINKRRKKQRRGAAKEEVSVEDLGSKEEKINDIVVKDEENEDLAENLTNTKKSISALTEEIERAKKMLSMDMEGFTAAKKTFEQINSKMPDLG